MDRIDINLFNAWHRVAAKVRADRVEALKRASRQFRANVRRPLRAWCMCLRASDTRINAANCLVEPLRDAVLTVDETVESLIENRKPHRLTIEGELIRTLLKPVFIPWPGEDWKRVAEKCGVTKSMLRNWLRAGTLRSDYRAPARTVGSRGPDVPVVFTPSAIDPNAFDGRPPQGNLWGSMWKDLWKRVPEQYELTAERVPRWRMLNGREVFRGWTWICPGRVGTDGAYLGCGRSCNRLFGPLPPWTVPEAVNDRLEIQMPDGSDLAGAWSPGFTDPDRGERSFACKQCWGVRDVSLIGPDGWNAFVTHLTGGLLYGHEVERPMDEAPETRRRRKTKRNVRPPKRRAQVREMILQGLTYREIAERLGIAHATAASTARLVYRDAGVRSREAFLAQSRRTTCATPAEG